LDSTEISARIRGVLDRIDVDDPESYRRRYGDIDAQWIAEWRSALLAVRDTLILEGLLAGTSAGEPDIADDPDKPDIEAAARTLRALASLTADPTHARSPAWVNGRDAALREVRAFLMLVGVLIGPD
jgi:hypothetical protein